MRSRKLRVRGIAAVVAALTLAIVAAPAGADPSDFPGRQVVQHNLVSDIPGLADLTEPALVNPWGLAQSPTSPTWVSDNGTNLSTLYRGDGVVAPPSIVPLQVQTSAGGPTGIVFNPTSQFVVDDGAGHSGPAIFIFAHLSGDITGWNPTVPPPVPPATASTVAQPAAHTEGAVYTGLAIDPGENPKLFGANFAAGTIDVFDGAFQPVHMDGAFVDPNLPEGYSPFNVTVLNGKVYVAYAKVHTATGEEEAGPGLGYVDVFTTAGELRQRLVSQGRLNAPWGMVIAPEGFGSLAGDLLVGNFGNGRINAFDLRTGTYHGTLRRPEGGPVEIEGLWGLAFGNGTTAATTTLLFAAGIEDETHGLYGALVPAS